MSATKPPFMLQQITDEALAELAGSVRGIVPVRNAYRSWPSWIVPSEVSAILAPDEQGCMVVLKNGREIDCFNTADIVAKALYSFGA